MKKLLLMICVLGGCVAPVCASEKSNEIVSFDIRIGRLNYNPLRYCDKEYIDFLNDNYGMQCKYNEPFLRVNSQYRMPEDQRELIKKEFIDPITLVPFKCFMKNNIIARVNDTFKKCDDVLFSFQKTVSNQKQQIQLILQSDFGDMDPKELLEQFKQEPCCMPGYILNEKGKLFSIVNTAALEKEKCDAGIMCKVGQDYGYGNYKQQYIQGINGFFGEEVQAEQEITQKAEQSALFYSRLKKLLCGGSIAAVICMYVLYQKFYVTAD